jgi:hypothetical protein
MHQPPLISGGYDIYAQQGSVQRRRWALDVHFALCPPPGTLRAVDAGVDRVSSSRPAVSARGYSGIPAFPLDVGCWALGVGCSFCLPIRRPYPYMTLFRIRIDT